MPSSAVSYTHLDVYKRQYLKIPAMLATLGTYQLFMGIAIISSGGSTVSGIPEAFTGFATTALFGYIPLSFVVFLILIAVMTFIMSKTKFGTRVYPVSYTHLILLLNPHL